MKRTGIIELVETVDFPLNYSKNVGLKISELVCYGFVSSAGLGPSRCLAPLSTDR
jgi:hypothetical protein